MENLPSRIWGILRKYTGLLDILAGLLSGNKSKNRKNPEIAGFYAIKTKIEF